MASPAAALATMVFNPSLESKLNTSWVLRHRWARSAANAGSACRMAADNRIANRGQGIMSTKSLRAWSTSAQACQVKGRVCSAILRACQARTPPVSTRFHSLGSRYRRSKASAIKARAAAIPVPCKAPSSAAQYSETSGVPSPPQAQARWITG
jgi:hypothetical protein